MVGGSPIPRQRASGGHDLREKESQPLPRKGPFTSSNAVVSLETRYAQIAKTDSEGCVYVFLCHSHILTQIIIKEKEATNMSEEDVGRV